MYTLRSNNCALKLKSQFAIIRHLHLKSVLRYVTEACYLSKVAPCDRWHPFLELWIDHFHISVGMLIAVRTAFGVHVHPVTRSRIDFCTKCSLLYCTVYCSTHNCMLYLSNTMIKYMPSSTHPAQEWPWTRSSTLSKINQNIYTLRSHGSTKLYRYSSWKSKIHCILFLGLFCPRGPSLFRWSKSLP